MGKTKDVRAAVEAELGFDPLVDSADIKVMKPRRRRDTRRHGAELPAVP
jgi:ribosome recycling factor